MKKLLLIPLLLVFILLCIGLCQSWAGSWKTTTPAGIRITVDKKAIPQYEERWGMDWDDIEWWRLDQFFFALRDFYGADVQPSQYRVKVKAWTPECMDEEQPGTKEFFQPGYGCIDGIYPGTWHLGDDPGQGFNSLCATAATHEMAHWMMNKARDKCWIKEAVGDCASHWHNDYQLGLCQ